MQGITGWQNELDAGTFFAADAGALRQNALSDDSSGFALTLVGLSLVTTLVIMAVTSNVVLSLGMVGALSIVRFRAAIKEPIEIVYLFWSIAAGIVIGAGMIPLAVIGSAMIGIVLIIFANQKTHESPYILIVNCKDEATEEAAL